jgi:hypothetical protein
MKYFEDSNSTPNAEIGCKMPFPNACGLVSVQKWWLVPEFKAGGGFEPETYMKYFEDSNSTPNAEIGCKMPFLDGHQLPGAHSACIQMHKVGFGIITHAAGLKCNAQIPQAAGAVSGKPDVDGPALAVHAA